MIQDVFKSILYMSLSSSFLIVAVLVARSLLQKSKLFRKLLWALVALKLTIPLSLESTFSLLPQKVAYMPDSGVAGGSGVVATETFSIDASCAVPYIWLLVFVALAVYGPVSFLKLKLKINDAVRLENNIFQSEKVESPFVFGIVKPKIYLPYKIKEETLGYVLKHEKTHIKYYDHITKIIGFVLLCIHWFNPLVWVAYMLFCKDTELACDEFVVKNMTTEQRKGYAKALCDIGINKVRISACPVAFGEVSLKARVKSAINYKKIGKLAVILSLAVCIVIAVCFMTNPKAEAATKDEMVEAEMPSLRSSNEKDNANVPVEEIVMVEVTEPQKEDETATQIYSWNEGNHNSSEKKYGLENLDKAELEKQQEEMRMMLQRKHEQEMEEFARKQQLYQSQNTNNSDNNSNIIDWDPTNNISKYGEYDNTPSIGRPGFENNRWVGWDY